MATPRAYRLTSRPAEGDADGKVCRHGGQQANDHELGRADGKCAERQREQGHGHGNTPVFRLSGFQAFRLWSVGVSVLLKKIVKRH